MRGFRSVGRRRSPGAPWPKVDGGDGVRWQRTLHPAVNLAESGFGGRAGWKPRWSHVLFLLGVVLGTLSLRPQCLPAPSVEIYRTGFEPAEGYDPEFTLAGQNGWTIYGTGGNGLITLEELFPGQGQQAYLGFFPPTDTNDIINVWRPLEFAPIPAETPVVTFSVQMTIIDSSTMARDDFRWSVYNTNGFRFFSIDFDNQQLLVSYALDDDAGFVPTGVTFTNEVVYGLTIRMDFGRNRWSAWLDDTLLAEQLPITTVNSALNLGDIDAVWAIHNPAAPGDNFMVFDNYRVVAAPPSDPRRPPVFETLRRLADGTIELGLFAESGQRYALEASGDFAQWAEIATRTAQAGWVEFRDAAAPAFARRFYRVRLVE